MVDTIGQRGRRRTCLVFEDQAAALLLDLWITEPGALRRLRAGGRAQGQQQQSTHAEMVPQAIM
jgi:hypothetical protein